jgi:hypothetical protein
MTPSTVALAAAALFSGALAQAGTVPGSALLDSAQQLQLETWLGQGPLQLANLYTFHPGDTAAAFHAAADGAGRTMTVMQVGAGGAHWLVGGYDPHSWESGDVWHETVSDAERTAFIFNLSTGAVYHQVPEGYVLPTQGQKQTWNSATAGPAFGEGGDLWVTGDMQHAYSWLATYGDPAEQGTSIIDRSLPHPLPTLFQLEAMEVFAIGVVPEPGAGWMLASGLGVVGWAARRRARRGA